MPYDARNTWGENKPPASIGLDANDPLYSNLFFLADGTQNTDTTLEDRSSSGNDATLSGGYTRNADGSINYNDTAALAKIASSTGLFNFLWQDNQSGTVSVWCKLDSTDPNSGPYRLVSNTGYAGAAWPGFALMFDDRSSGGGGGTDHYVYAAVGDSSSNYIVISTPDLAYPKDTDWHHVCAVIDTTVSASADFLWIYIDGVEQAVATKIKTFATSGSASDDLSIGGATGSGQEFIGDIDNVEIYDKALSAAEVLWLYENRFHAYEEKIAWPSVTGITDPVAVHGQLLVDTLGQDVPAGCPVAVQFKWTKNDNPLALMDSSGTPSNDNFTIKVGNSSEQHDCHFSLDDFIDDGDGGGTVAAIIVAEDSYQIKATDHIWLIASDGTTYSNDTDAYDGAEIASHMEDASPVDVSGNAYTLTVSGGPTSVETNFGNALRFDGVDDQIQINGLPANLDGSGGITGFCLFEVSSLSVNQRLIALGCQSSSPKIGLGLLVRTTGEIRLSTRSNTSDAAQQIDSSTTISTGKFVAAVFRMDVASDELKLWWADEDDTAINTDTASVSFGEVSVLNWESNNDNYIGRELVASSPDYLTGDVSDWALWGSVKSDDWCASLAESLLASIKATTGTHTKYRAYEAEAAAGGQTNYATAHSLPLSDQTEDTSTAWPLTLIEGNNGGILPEYVKTNGGDIRVYDHTGTELPVDVKKQNDAAEPDYVNTLISVPHDHAAIVCVFAGDSSLSEYAEDATNGREAVWPYFDQVVQTEDDATNIDRTSNDNDPTEVGSPEESETDNITGLDFDGVGDMLAAEVSVAESYPLMLWGHCEGVAQVTTDANIVTAAYGGSDATDDRMGIGMYRSSNPTDAGKMYYFLGIPSASVLVTTPSTYDDGDRHHFIAISFSATDHRIYSSSGELASESTSITTPTQMTRFGMGGRRRQTVDDLFWEGEVFETAISLTGDSAFSSANFVESDAVVICSAREGSLWAAGDVVYFPEIAAGGGNQARFAGALSFF